MARTSRLKKSEVGIAHYHLMSRTNDKRFLFGKGRIKTALVETLKRAAEFSGIELNAYVAMDNHFHVVCTVTRTEEPVSEAELVRRYGVLKGRAAAEKLAMRWRELAAAGLVSTLEAEQNRLRSRMNDISEMVKTFKEAFNIWFKRETPYCGSIWSGRFMSTMIEDGHYLAICKRYVAMNPVRAGMVRMTKDYLWVWSEDSAETGVFAGSVPVEVGMRRIAQIGGGKLFGSAEFVTRWIFGFGDKLRSRSAIAHSVGEIAYSSHGWRLAERAVA